MKLSKGDKVWITNWPLIPGGEIKGTIINLPEHRYDYSTAPPTPSPSHVEFTTSDGEYGYWKASDGGNIVRILLCKQCGTPIDEDDKGFCSEECYFNRIAEMAAAEMES